MSVPVKNFFFHRTLHNELLADFGFMNLSAEATGVYFRLRIMAARTNNNGSIAIGTDRMSGDALVEYIMSQFRLSKRAAGKIIEELKKSEHIKVMPSGKVVLPKYVHEQEGAPSPAAERQRRSREMRKTFDELSSRKVSDFPPPPSPPTTDDSGFDFENTGEGDACDLSRRRVTGHTDVTDSNNRTVIDRNISRSRTSSTPGTTTTTTGGDGGGGKRITGCSPDLLRDLDVFQADPIDSACLMSGERDPYHVNGFRKLLARVGDGIFRTALVEVKDAMFAGKAQKPGRLLHVVCGRIYQEVHGARSDRSGGHP